jgi:hypothetical protein
MAPRRYKMSASISAVKEVGLRVGVPRPLLSTSPGEFVYDGEDVPSAGISGRRRVGISRVSRVFFHDGIADGKEGDGGREGEEGEGESETL